MKINENTISAQIIDADRSINIDLIGGYAALLAATEVMWGGMLHLVHVPFSGTLLSLNQILLLTKASLAAPSKLGRLNPAIISIIAAALKSLGPVGKKLTPMLAITLQGMLFNAGTILLGYSLAGRLLGACMASLWGWIQPLLLYYLIFGHRFFEGVMGIVKEFGPYFLLSENRLYILLSCLVVVKLVLACAVVFLAPHVPMGLMPSRKTQLAIFMKARRESSEEMPATFKSHIRGALRDLIKPTFVFAVLSTTLFFFLTTENLQMLFWNILRPISMGFLCFFAIRWLPLGQFAAWLESKHTNIFSSALKAALQKVEGNWSDPPEGN